MVRKILLGIVALLILAGAGTYMLIKTKGDVLLQKFSAYVEETTGAPLLMDELPTLTFFPQPGLNLAVSTSASVADANKKTNVVPNCSEQPQIYTCGSLSVSLAELKSFFLSEITIC